MKKTLLIILILGVAVFFLMVVYNATRVNNNSAPSTTALSPSPSPTPLFLSPTPAPVVIEKTTATDVVSSMGNPISSTTEGDETVLSYPTKNQYWNSDYYFKDGVLVFVKERIFPLNNNDYKRLVVPAGDAPVVLFGPDSRSGIFLYVFPERGASFLANKDTGFVYEAWRHPTNTVNQLLLLPQLQGYSSSETFGPEGLPEEPTLAP